MVVRCFCQTSESAFKRKYVAAGDVLGKRAFGTVSTHTTADGGQVAVKKLHHGSWPQSELAYGLMPIAAPAA